MIACFGVYVPGVEKPIGVFMVKRLAELWLDDMGFDAVGGVEVRPLNYEVAVGDRVRSLKDLCGVPAGTDGLVVEDYGTGITVAWDLPDRPLPDLEPTEIAALFAVDPGCPLRDGFDKETELRFLMVLR